VALGDGNKQQTCLLKVIAAPIKLIIALSLPQ
jgi:hypothetical protein